MRIALAIKSCHKHSARRDAQIATWLPEWQQDYFFVIGKPQIVLPDTLSCLVDDGFANIAPKILCSVLYALENNYEHLVVADDDTYIRPARLLKSGFAKHDYVGFARTSGLFYNQDVPYMQGSCYVLSARAMEHIARAGEHIMVPGVIDDGAVGRCLVGKVSFTHDWRFVPGPEALPLPTNEWISVHKALPATMHRIHEMVNKNA